MIFLADVHLEHDTAAGTVVALANVNVRVYPGEYVALLGASGSGKTTLLNVIGGLVLPTAGDVEVAGHRISGADEAERARLRLSEIGVVFQDNNLIAEFTAIENVMLPLRARGWKKRDASEAAEKLLEDVGLNGLGHRRPAALSGGQKQRVGIARGLAGGRQILLADEPTGSLDSASSRSVFELLGAIAGQGVAVVVATHDPIIMQYVTRVISIQDGSIIDDSAADARA